MIFQSEEDKGTSMEVTFPHIRPSGEMLIPADNDKSHTHTYAVTDYIKLVISNLTSSIEIMQKDILHNTKYIKVKS